MDSTLIKSFNLDDADINGILGNNTAKPQSFPALNIIL